MKAFQLLYEILNPKYNPFLNLFEDIEKRVVKEKDRGDWVEKEEMWTVSGDDETPMKSAYSPEGDYIGNVDTVKMLLKKGITKFEKTHPDHCVVSIGFNPEENKWYGWSHRAIYGFGIGDKCKVGDCGFVPSNADEFIKQLKSMYSKYDLEKDQKDPSGNEKGLGVMVKGKGPRSTTHFEPYPKWGRGEWTAKTLDDAKQMAIDFAAGVS